MPGKNGAPTRRSSRVTLRVPLRIYEPGSNKPMVSGGSLARLVAIEFVTPSPGFWGVVFPKIDPCRSQTRNYAR